MFYFSVFPMAMHGLQKQHGEHHRFFPVYPAYFALLFYWIIMVCLPNSIQASEQCEHWIARSGSVEGTMLVMRESSNIWTSTIATDTYCPGDKIRVGRLSRATVIMVNESILRLGPNTTLSFIRGQQKEKRALVRIFKGVVNFFSRVPKSLNVQTPFVNGSVEGTEFLVQVEEDQVSIHVFKGLVKANNDFGSLDIASGQTMVASMGKAPEHKTIIHPRDAVHWALYYPMVLNSQEAAIGHASDLLKVGQANEAERELNRILAKDPENSDAYTVKAIIALVQDRKEEALSLAGKAVQCNPRSAAAKIALSYGQQAHFDILAALETLKDAVRDEPQNNLAKARLAELYLSTGELDKALDTAKAAASQDPSIGHSQTVLGFTYLAQIKTNKARAAFEKAISLDQGAPLARLGLGLAEIKQGQLKEGRTDIDMAEALDLNNSLIRSYLGKAYYEEKRDKLARRQFTIAKELDPHDPTPYLYDAILKQAANQPVEALLDIQKSIELNDNRAVYRSRLLLDEDLAVRNASLARIYSDLGFEKLALVEGWKSVSVDPTNYSAHRFLADSYAALPRHEIARVSELLQSQLFQPINITPIPPQLAESNLFILEGAGPSDLSFNEYTPLFNRNRIAFQADSVIGGNGTFGDDIVFSGLWGPMSFSFGQFHYETEGFRPNNDQKRDLLHAFAQIEPWHRTSFFAEFRANDSNFGDLALRFDPEVVFINDRNQEKIRSFRLGMHHSISIQSDIIATFILNDVDARFENRPEEYEFQSHEKGYMGEVQQLYRWSNVSLISGLGVFRSDLTENDTFSQELFDKIYHTNLYFYSKITIPENIILTLGVSGDFLEGIIDVNRFNPKIGVIWNPVSSTTLRAAVTHILNRSMISNQTLEPTQVAGFNQFYNDLEGAEAWRYGVAIDHRFYHNLHGGIELSRRDLDTPYIDREYEVREAEWCENSSRAYLSWSPYNWLSTNVVFQWEQFERDLDFTGEELIHSLETNKVSFDVSAYCPFGITTKFKASFIDQEGEFDPNPTSFITVEDRDQFWVFDLLMSYRFPRRFGLLSIEAKNLFNEEFKYQTIDRAGSDVAYERLVMAKITWSF